MATFEQAVEGVLEHEGGYVCHPHDPGGETNFGISKRQYPDLDIKSLTRAQAVEIYRRDYWQDTFDKIPLQKIANKLFDGVVNCGPVTAVKILQRALGDIGFGVDLDGRFGPQTLQAVKLACLSRTKPLLDAWRARLARHYVDLALQDQTQLVFLDGWLRRAVA